MKLNYCLIGMLVALTPLASNADMYSELQNVYESNPVIKSQRAALRAADADVSASSAGFKPYLGVSANAGAARTKVGDYSFDYNPVGVGLEFQQNIFEGFSTIAQYKGARAVRDAETASLYATEQETFLNAINAYIAVLRADEVLKLNQNNQRVLQEYYNYCADNARVGRLTKTDVAQASARVEMAKYALADAQAKYDNAVETFRRVYGDAPSEFTEIDLERMEKLFPATVDDAVEYAMKNHPVILALQSKEKAAREKIVVARKSMLPAVDVRGSIMQIEDIPYVDKVRDSRIGVYLKMPLYDKGNAFANVDKVRYTVDGIQEQTVNAQRTITESLHQAWNMYDAQAAAITAAEAGVKANKMALSGTRDEQKRGRRTVLDVLNAEQELLNTQVSLAQAKFGRTSAFFAVLSATGLLTPENLGLKIQDEE